MKHQKNQSKEKQVNENQCKNNNPVQVNGEPLEM
jgi:hypothetical protein